MRLFWINGHLALEPESAPEAEALLVIWRSLRVEGLERCEDGRDLKLFNNSGESSGGEFL